MMMWFRSFASVLVAPVVYGVICVPTLGVLLGAYPELLNEQGGTDHVGLILASETIQFIVLVICGYLAALTAGREEMKHGLAVAAVMLGIGIAVQLSFWESMPAWHHFVFFACILVGIILGARLRLRQKGTAVSRVL